MFLRAQHALPGHKPSEVTANSAVFPGAKAPCLCRPCTDEQWVKWGCIFHGTPCLWCLDATGLILHANLDIDRSPNKETRQPCLGIKLSDFSFQSLVEVGAKTNRFHEVCTQWAIVGHCAICLPAAWSVPVLSFWAACACNATQCHHCCVRMLVIVIDEASVHCLPMSDDNLWPQ